jgi:hypothetical protein
VDKSTGIATNGQLHVNGTLNYAGTLTITNLGGTLWAGDTFQLFSANAIGGSFGAMNLPPLTAGFNWNWTPASGTLSITSSVALNPTNVIANVTGGTLALSWPEDHLGWRLETNALEVADANAWFTLPDSTTTNQVFLPVDLAKTNVFFRLVFP